MPHKQYEIAEYVDLTLHLPEYEQPSRSDNDDKVLRKIHAFRVVRAQLTNFLYSKVLLEGGFKEAVQDIVSLLEDDRDAVMVWMCMIHDITTERCFGISINSA